MTPYKIDWVLFRAQKQTLDKLIDSGVCPEMLEGVLHLMDRIQDAAVECGEATEEEVFGELK